MHFRFIQENQNKKDIRKLSSYRLGAYMSLEASIIMPLVIFLISSIIYLSFFLYNRTTLEVDAYKMAFLAANHSKSQAFIDRNWGNLFDKHYVGISNINKSSKTTIGKVEVELSIDYQIPFVKLLGAKGSYKFKTRRVADVINPTKKLRQYRFILSGLDG